MVFHARATKTEVGGTGNGDAHAGFDVAKGGRVGAPVPQCSPFIGQATFCQTDDSKQPLMMNRTSTVCIRDTNRGPTLLPRQDCFLVLLILYY